MASTTPQAQIGVRTWWAAIVCIATAGTILRFYDLPLKPLHHDEGVNTLFLTGLVNPPHMFLYNPTNFHGPTLFYVGWLHSTVLGLTTTAIRSVTALTGVLALLLVLPLRRQIGTVGALAAAALLAVSPGAVYFSRYFIHEMLLVCFTVATVVAAVSWGHQGRAVHLYLAAAAAGLMFATKETAIISAVVLCAAATAAPVLCDLRFPVQDVQGGNLARAILRAIRLRWHTATERMRQRGGAPRVIEAVVVFLIVNALLYSSFLTNRQGMVDAVKSFAVWTQTSTATQTHPWYTYLAWLSAEESPLLILGGVGALAALWRRDAPFAVFAGLWAVGILTAYSAIPYKTPWLALNVIAPLAICAGYTCDIIWRQRTRVLQALAAIALVVALGVASYQATVLNFVHYDNGQYPYVYVHTTREALQLVREIDRLEELNPGVSIAVTSRDHFPLPWYFRSYRAGYYGTAMATADPLVVASDDQQATLNALLGEAYQLTGSYALRPGVQLVLYVRRDLRRTLSDPIRRPTSGAPAVP